MSATTLTSDTIFAGVAATATALPAASTDFTNAAIISSVKVKTGTADTRIAATNLGKITLGTVQINNGGTPFGLAADKIAAVSGSTGPGVKFSLKKLDTPADFTKQANGLDLMDARIVLI